MFFVPTPGTGDAAFDLALKSLQDNLLRNQAHTDRLATDNKVKDVEAARIRAVVARHQVDAFT
ncbi:MAG: hypothetical protein IPJ65_17850 [Archangiaceae bacterium]|nr:hypothetical protein [Archangiaceae bacterium]